jgi:hypothetical protein
MFESGSRHHRERRCEIAVFVSEVAGKAWRPEYEGAWAAAFDVVAGAMLVGASSSSASALAA